MWAHDRTPSAWCSGLAIEGETQFFFLLFRPTFGRRRSPVVAPVPSVDIVGLARRGVEKLGTKSTSSVRRPCQRCFRCGMRRGSCGVTERENSHLPDARLDRHVRGRPGEAVRTGRTGTYSIVHNHGAACCLRGCHVLGLGRGARSPAVCLWSATNRNSNGIWEREVTSTPAVAPKLRQRPRHPSATKQN